MNYKLNINIRHAVMPGWTRWLLFLVLLGFSGTGLTQSTDSLKVLFVGNSYTYFWNLPQTFEAMAREINPHTVARQSTAGGVGWKEHWEGKGDLQTRQMIRTGKWDYVVLQNQSLSGIENRDAFMEYGKKLIDEIKESGATPILYTTWARRYNPMQQKAISKSYSDLATAEGIERIPVGEVWSGIRELREDLELYDRDQSHPSPMGTYVTAIVFVKVLLDVDTLEIPSYISSDDHRGYKIYWNITPRNDAQFVQDFVDQYFYK